MPRSTRLVQRAPPPRVAIALALVGGLFVVGFAGVHLPASVQAYQQCNPPPAGASCSYLDIWNLSPPLQLVADVVALGLGCVVLLGAVLLWRSPDRHESLGLVILIASGASAVGYGGAIVGLFLGGLGGLLALTHVSGRPARIEQWNAGVPVNPSPARVAGLAASRPSELAPPIPPRAPAVVAAPAERPVRSRPVLNPLLRPWNDSAPDELPPVPWPPKEASPTNGEGPSIPPELRRSYPELPRAAGTGVASPPEPSLVPEPLPLTVPPLPPSATMVSRGAPRSGAHRSSARSGPSPSSGLPALPTGPRRRPRGLTPVTVPIAPAKVGSPPVMPIPSDVAPAAPPRAGSRAAPATGARHAWQCAKCGLVNAPWSISCTRCKARGPDQ